MTGRAGWAPRHAVALLSAALGLLATGLLLLAVPETGPVTSGQLALAVALLAGFAVAERSVVHLELGGSAYTVSLAEVPLVLGLFWLPPELLVAARVLGALVALHLHRRQSASKLVFNACMMALEAVVAALVLHTVAPGLDERPLLVAWGAVLIACLAASCTSATAVLGAVALTAAEAPAPGAVRRALLQSAPVTLVAASLGFVLAHTVSADLAAAGPLLVVTTAVLLAYAAHIRLRDRHERLSSLYGFVHEVSSGSSGEGPVSAVLSQTLELLKCEVAVLTQVVEASPDGPRVLLRHRLSTDGPLVTTQSPAGPADWPVTRCLDDSRPLLGQRGTDDHAVAAYLQSQGVRDGVLVAVPGPSGVTGALFVGGRKGEHATFEAADLEALEGLAGHASVALHNGSLLERLTWESRHDLLTGLPNRTEFQARLAELLDLSRAVGVLFMDLDRFKDVNDTLGHHAGDHLLEVVAQRLLEGLDTGTTVARLGGDEFAVLLPGCDARTGVEVATRLRRLIEQPVHLDGVSVDVGVSIGMALSPEHGRDVSVLMRRADVAMYDAKERDGVAVYDAQRNEPSSSRLALVAQLRTGLADGELLLHYQPQVSCKDGRTVRFEALLRWRHPVRGMVSPDEFLPVAERAGMLQEITLFVLRRALDDLVLWRQTRADVGVSVNLSPRNLLDAHLPADVRAELARRSLPADCLTLEITEGTLMADPERAVETLRELRTTGVRLSIDDFGTGYSSLAYLKHLPVDEVKVDQSFVKGLADDPTDVAIVRAVLALADSLCLEVVAEGVEDEPSMHLLQALGCRYLQGYHVSRPMTGTAAPAWLASEQPWRSARAPRELMTVPGPRHVA